LTFLSGGVVAASLAEKERDNPAYSPKLVEGRHSPKYIGKIPDKLMPKPCLPARISCKCCQ